MILHTPTPLLQSSALSAISECAVWLKMEALQPTGSFKIRGIGHACEVYADQGVKRFISSSGGNAGLAVAYAGRQLSLPVTVVVPQSTSDRAIELLELENASVKIHGESWQEANELAISMTGEDDAFLHPFDDPLLWQGHASLIDEVHESGLKPDAIVLSVGGGGLLSGICKGLKKYGWQTIPVFAVETEGAASFNQASIAGKPVELDRICTIATSLGAKSVCQNASELYHQRPINSTLVSDKDALNACRQFIDDHRLVVEPACGASLSIGYTHHHILKDFENVLIVVCGGVTATYEQLMLWHDAC